MAFSVEGNTVIDLRDQRIVGKVRLLFSFDTRFPFVPISHDSYFLHSGLGKINTETPVNSPQQLDRLVAFTILFSLCLFPL